MVEPLFCNINKKSTLFRHISEMFGVCTYFILEQNNLVIIDPGKLDNTVFEWLDEFDNLSKIVYITHEHFDHHYHANKVLNLKKTFLYIPSESFNQALIDSKKNLSYYYDQNVQTISKSITDISYLKVIKTPGHSRESYCFIYDDVVFGGDTIIDKKYLVFKLPGGDKLDFNNSVERLKSNVNLSSIVLPGHGDFFCLDNWII